MKTITMGAFTNAPDAEEAITGLLKKKVDRDAISYVYTNHAGDIEEHTVHDALLNEGKEKAKATGAGIASGAFTGAAIGTVAGLAVTAGVLPGLGAIFIAGPLMTMLGLGTAAGVVASGAVTGAAAGTLIGGLSAYGLSDPDAHIYEEHIARGDILVTVEDKDADGDILKIFKDNDALDIRQLAV